MNRRSPAALENYGLVADVGGTNIRFGLVDLDDASKLRVQASASFNAAAYGGLADAARGYLRGLSVSRPPAAAAFAIAGPVQDGRIALTNSTWRSSSDELRAALQVDHVRLINDYEAIALAVPHLESADCVPIGSVPPFAAGTRETIAIIGPGTGLGVAGFVRSARTIVPLVTEGGHVSFAPVDAREIVILQFLMRRHGRVSMERILSGPGLRALYEAMAEIEGAAAQDLSAEEITRNAEDDPASLCSRVFAQFCAILGSAAGDIALAMGARDGVLIAGGILPAHAELFARSAFRARFEAKGRFEDYMKRIPTRLLVQTRVGLLGAASLLASEEIPRKLARTAAR